jgi:hypothetical protein
VAGLDRLNPLEPHHATAFGARWVFQVIDSAFHREIKARTDAQPQATINPFMIGYLRRSDRHLEFFGDAEGDLFAGLDLDRFTRRRITAHAGSTIPHLQTPESGDLYSLAFLQVLSDQTGKILKNLSCFLVNLCFFAKAWANCFVLIVFRAVGLGAAGLAVAVGVAVAMSVMVACSLCVAFSPGHSLMRFVDVRPTITRF